MAVHLITGGAGFVGVNLLRRLLDAGDAVVVVDDLSRGKLEFLKAFTNNPKFTFLKLNCSDTSAFRNGVSDIHARDPITEIWHMAANSDIPAGVADPRIDLQSTFMTTFATLLVMRDLKIPTLHFASSSAVYGDLKDLAIAENSGPLEPISNYGAMKLASEGQIRAAVESYIGRANVFRFPNVVGVPATHGVIIDLVQKAHATPSGFDVLGNGTQQKIYLHVEDLVDAMLYIRENARNAYNVFNIGPADDGITVREIAEAVRGAAAPSAELRFGSGEKGWTGDVPRFRYDTAKLTALGWSAKMDSRGAIMKAVSQIEEQIWSVTQAVILAGGKGTRLAAQLQGLPKCLIDVDGIPLLQRQIQLLKAHGVNDVVILVNHAADQVTRFLDGNSGFGLRTRLIDDGDPRGTAGAILASMDVLEKRFLVLYGDTLLNVDLDRLMAAHVQSGADATLFLHPNDHPADSDLVEIDDDGWIRAFHPYPHNSARWYPNLVNAALYVIEKQSLESWRNFQTPSDFGKDLFPAMLAAGSKLKGYASFEYIKDIGTPGRLSKAVGQLRRGVVARASLTQKQRAVFIDRDGTLNIHRGFLRNANSLELISGAADAVKRLNDSEFRLAVVTNQPVIARGETTFDEMRNIHAKLETILGKEGAFVDAIFVCPHHPDRGYAGEVAALKIDCDCRKPNLGLLERATRELNIDLSQSWLVGDTTSDLETARRAGLRSILVQTGEAGMDAKYDAQPTHTVRDLREAADFIIANSTDSQ